jgi:hypothetical protein
MSGNGRKGDMRDKEGMKGENLDWRKEVLER